MRLGLSPAAKKGETRQPPQLGQERPRAKEKAKARSWRWSLPRESRRGRARRARPFWVEG